MPITVESGVNVGPGITIDGTGAGTTLLLELDATDYSGSGSTWTANVGSNATLFGVPGYTASSPTYFTFDPDDVEYASVPDLGSLGTWTIEAWFRVNSSLSGRVTSVITNEYDLANSLNFSIGTNNAPGSYNICVGYFNSGWHNTTGFAPSLSTWYYVVGTYDGTTIKQYNNGTINTTTSGAGAPSSGGEVRIARRWDSSALTSTNFFPGDVAIVRVYSGAKDATAVTNSWNADKARFGY